MAALPSMRRSRDAPTKGRIFTMGSPDTPASVVDPRRHWRPSALLHGSLALNLGAAAVVLARPRLWPWAVSAVLADHLLLAAAGLWPRSHLLGPNWTHLPAATPRGGRDAAAPTTTFAPAAAPSIAITIDDGPDPEVTPRVLDLLDEHDARATFFCIGERVAEHPALARAIVARQHEIGNHTYRHVMHFSLLGPRAMAEEIARAQEVIGASTGAVARFFRAPAGLRNPFLEPVLARANLQLVSWTRRGFDTVTGSPTRVLGSLTRHLRPGDILLLHDGHAARTRTGVPVILEVLPRLLTAVRAAGLTPVTLCGALAQASAPARIVTAPS
jgi:peptidoglycan-N-acetylglucosamine deacetylase